MGIGRHGAESSSFFLQFVPFADDSKDAVSEVVSEAGLMSPFFQMRKLSHTEMTGLAKKDPS